MTVGGQAPLLDTSVAIPEGAVIRETRTHVFNEPGYYLITVTSQAEVIDEPRRAEDRYMPLANENASQVWLLIATTGGRLDRSYDDSWTRRDR